MEVSCSDDARLVLLKGSMKLVKVAISLLFFSPTWVFSQGFIEALEDGRPEADGEAPALVTEKILKLSLSRRIIILSNQNSSYAEGDYISLVLSEKLVARCLVAKLQSGQAGIKVVKIYDASLWKEIRPQRQVQVIRGDDSYFTAEKRKEEEAESLIESEDDLYSDINLSEGELDEENTGRLIKNDNLISVFLGFVEAPDAGGNMKRYRQVNGAWMYQLANNFWGEVSYGQNIINDYPNLGLDTKLSSVCAKIKYTIAAPSYSYLQPYVGYQLVGASSPGAGVEDGTTHVDVLNLELDRVEDLKRQSAVFGITVLKRLVPGWFARADLGSDLVSFGFGLEF